MGNYDASTAAMVAYCNSTETKTLFGFDPTLNYSSSSGDVY